MTKITLTHCSYDVTNLKCCGLH